MPGKRGTLEEIRIAEPCHAAWDRMDGDDRIRFCGECQRNVYNLSAMSRAEAERLVYEAEGRVCVRFYQRRDGTVLTDNCPVGLRNARRWMKMQLAALAASFAGVLALVPWHASTKQATVMGQRVVLPVAPVDSRERAVPTRHINAFLVTGELITVRPRADLRKEREAAPSDTTIVMGSPPATPEEVAVMRQVPLPPVMGEMVLPRYAESLESESPESKK